MVTTMWWFSLGLWYERRTVITWNAKKARNTLDSLMNGLIKLPPELKETLSGCEYQLSLTVGDLPEGVEDYESLGLKWPD